MEWGFASLTEVRQAYPEMDATKMLLGFHPVDGGKMFWLVEYGCFQK